MDKGLINMTVVPLEKDFLLPYGETIPKFV